MTRIYLIRHAEAEGNLYRRVQGQYDANITGRGRLQVEALARRFQDVPIDAVWSSDLNRAKATARAIYVPKDLPLRTDPGLREVNVGVWEDLPWGLVGQEWREQLHFFDTSSPNWHVEGSETFQLLRERLRSALTRIAAAHDGQTVAVFSHGMAIRNALAILQGLSVAQGREVPHCDNTGVSLLEYDEGGWRVVYMNDNSHLPEELSTFAGQKWWQDEEAGALADANLWYRHLDMDREWGFYYQCRKDAWITIHGSLDKFDGAAFTADAAAQARVSPDAVWQVMLLDKPVGLVQLDIPTAQAQDYGPVPFLYLLPDYRGMGLGVQLIGQAVSVFRRMGCDRLRLRCAPDNAVAQKFYAKYGFYKIGEAAGSRVPLDLLEKRIGLEDQ